MALKLYQYLDTHPEIITVWVSKNLDFVTGPCDGYEKTSAYDALSLAISALDDTDVKAPEQPAMDTTKQDPPAPEARATEDEDPNKVRSTDEPSVPTKNTKK